MKDSPNLFSPICSIDGLAPIFGWFGLPAIASGLIMPVCMLVVTRRLAGHACSSRAVVGCRVCSKLGSRLGSVCLCGVYPSMFYGDKLVGCEGVFGATAAASDLGEEKLV